MELAKTVFGVGNPEGYSSKRVTGMKWFLFSQAEWRICTIKRSNTTGRTAGLVLAAVQTSTGHSSFYHLLPPTQVILAYSRCCSCDKGGQLTFDTFRASVVVHTFGSFDFVYLDYLIVYNTTVTVTVYTSTVHRRDGAEVCLSFDPEFQRVKERWPKFSGWKMGIGSCKDLFYL